MGVLGISSDSVFTALVLLLMLSMRAPGRTNGIVAASQNVGFWVYLVYWLKSLATVLRIPAYHANLLPENTIVLFFCWTGCMLVTLSTVVPCQLFLHYRIRGHFVVMQHQKRFKFCVVVLVTYCAGFCTSCLLLAMGVTTTKTMLLCWRVVFFVNSFVEASFLTLCLVLVTRITKNKDRFQGLKRHLQITLYMRGGLCSTIALKIIGVFPHDLVASMHLFFIFTGLLLYHLRAVGIKSCSDFRIVRAVLRVTEQLLIVDATNPLRPTMEQRKKSIARQTTTESYPQSNIASPSIFTVHKNQAETSQGTSVENILTSGGRSGAMLTFGSQTAQNTAQKQ